MKRCSKCRVDKGDDQFAAHPFTVDKLQSWCRTCKRDGMRELRARRKEERDAQG